MVTRARIAWRLVFAGLVLGAAAACLDPLYEDGAVSRWYVCCDSGEVNTCACPMGQECVTQLTPCAGGTCSMTSSCQSGTGGGGMDAGSAGGGTGGGGATGGGSGGAAGGGTGGATGGGLGGGTGGASGGGAGGGTGGGSGGGTSGSYELCCVSSRISTCACPNAVCPNLPYTICPLGRCVAGTTTGTCP